MNILVDVYIKCRTSLKLEGSDVINIYKNIVLSL